MSDTSDTPETTNKTTKYTNEKELLIAFRDRFMNMDPDGFVGYRVGPHPYWDTSSQSK